jgi:Rrf2 family iron-sulfur cluster assembly transcriptional regulator
MLLSRESEYAIQTLLHLADKREESYVFIREIAQDLNIPFFYLSKILNKLVKANILLSQKGPKGGIRFALDPNSIKVYDIILIIDGDDIFNKCVLGLPSCGGENPCAVHNTWWGLRGDIEKMFREKSIVELSRTHLKPILK